MLFHSFMRNVLIIYVSIHYCIFISLMLMASFQKKILIYILFKTALSN